MASYSSQYSSQVKRKEAAARVRTKCRPTTGLPLSAVLAQTPSLFDGRRITAVDKNVTAIDTLPERVASQVKTLYLSKNSLASLDGVQQFRGLRALSAADNALADLAALGALHGDGLALEAANFEGNPLAELPNYRAHVLEALGPSLSMLDNRAVTPEERAAAPGAVGHEATILALMLSNACLVHKLGRAVQLVRLHCELKCAVLGGQCGAGGSLHEGACATDAAKFLQLWDYEGSLSRQERHAILLAIRREVGRRYKRMVLAGAKLDGSAKSWQQAFAQVMLAQQETVAGLMRMLEDARSEAAVVLAPLTRPASPRKLRALHSAQEAECRVKQDREALITELRDAFLGLAEGGSGQASPRRSAAHYEQRIRTLHAALQASSSNPGSEHQGAAAPDDWSIPAAHGGSSMAQPSPAASPAASPSKAPLARPKSALRQQPAKGGRPAEGSTGRPLSSPAARPGSGRHLAIPRPPSAASSPRAASRLPAEPAQQATLPSHAGPEGQSMPAWQPDDGLAAAETEQHRPAAPAPFGGSCVFAQQAHHQRPHSRSLLLQVTAAAATELEQEEGCWAAAERSPSAWTANPLAKAESSPPRPGSPAMQNLAAMLAHEGEQKQIAVLQATVADLEAANATLQEANSELADSLGQLHAHAQGLEARLAQQQGELGGRVRELETEAEAAKHGRQELEAEAVMLRLERDAQRAELAVQLAAHQADIEARAAELAVLRQKVQELEAQDPITLMLTVSYEAELRAERVRSAALEARANEAAAKLAAHQRQERLRLASEFLGGQSCLRRVFQRWQAAAAEHAEHRQLGEVAAAARRTQLLRKWLGRWRLALQRSRLLSSRAHQRDEALLHRAWAVWRQRCHDARLHRALEVAAELHRQAVVLRQVLGAWGGCAAAGRQVELAPDHPTMLKATQLRRARLLAVGFQAWRGWLACHIKPKLQQLSQSKAHFFAGAQRRAWLAWREYVSHRRHRAMLKEVAAQHLLSKHVRLWRAAAEEGKLERLEALRGAVSNQVLLLRRGWKAWTESLQARHAAAAAAAVAAQHRKQVVLRSAWHCWQQWVQLANDAKDRQRARVLHAAFQDWRMAAKAAEKRRTAAQFHERKVGARWQQAFHSWRRLVGEKRRRLQRLAHAQEVLLRWRLGRAVGTWRRGVLVSKLQRALEQVQQLHAAISNVKGELERKAGEMESLESVKLTVETHAQSLSLRVSSLDSELASAEAKAAALQLALEQAEQNSAAAAAARAEADVARDAALEVSARACSERDAAAAGREEALAEAAQARGDRDTAQQQAGAVEAARAAAEEARVAAEQAAAAAAAERDSLAAQLEQTGAEVGRLLREREGLVKDLEVALAELQRLTDALGQAQQDNTHLKKQHESALSDKVLATAEKQALEKQAERLAAICEEKERQCRQLQGTVEDLQAQVSSLRLLDEELRHIAERSDSLHAENTAKHAQLQALAAAAAGAAGDRSRLQASLEAMRVEEAKLLAALEEQQRQRQELAGTVEVQQAAKQSLESQLQRSQEAVAALRGEREGLAQVAARLEGEREGLMGAVGSLEGEKQALEAQVAQLREQLQRSNAVLDSCREMLAGCMAGGQQGGQQPANLPLQELLGCVAAMVAEKDAALKAFAQDTRERSERMQALQTQVEQLSRQVLVGAAAGSPPRHAPPAPQASKTLGSPASVASLSNGTQQRPGSPAAQFSFSSAGFASPAAGRPLPTPSLYSPASAASSRAPPAGAGAPAAHAAAAQDPTTPYFASSFAQPAVRAGSPLAASTAALQSLLAGGAARPAPATAASPAGSVSPSQSTRSSAGCGDGSSISCTIQRAPQLAGGSMPVSPGGTTPSSRSSAAASPDHLRTLLLRQGCNEAACDAALRLPEASQERLGFLLELVVQKRITADQAQEVIQSAGEGDARPLLRVLDSVKRRIQGQDQTPPAALEQQQGRAAPPPGLSPGSASELAAVRRQIQLLQSSIQPGSGQRH